MFKDIPSEVIVFAGIIAAILFSGVLALLVRYAKQLIDQVVAQLQASRKWDLLVAIARMAVRAAEQAKLNGWIEAMGKAAKEEALRIAQQWLDAQGLEEIDVSQFANMIEAAYNELKTELKTHMTDTNTAMISEQGSLSQPN